MLLQLALRHGASSLEVADPKFLRGLSSKVRSVLSTDFVVLDVGARYGVHPSLRRLVGLLPVHLFEPDDTEADRLSKQYEDREGVSVHSVALGEASSARAFALREHRGLSGFADVSADESSWGIPVRGVTEQARFNVRVRPLSEFLDDRPAIIKIDTEGSELEILRSAEAKLKSVAGLRIEINLRPLWSSGTTFAELDAFLAHHGFDFVGFDAPANGFFHGRLPLPESRGQLISGDALWVNKPSAGSYEDSHVICRSLFYYLNDSEGLGLNELRRASGPARRRIVESSYPSIEGLLYAMVLRHLASARILPVFDAATIEAEHMALFQCPLPGREGIFSRLNNAGLELG
jgi:FkbM family methyltransferase